MNYLIQRASRFSSFLLSNQRRLLSSSPYYDSQSGIWVYPPSPETITLILDASDDEILHDEQNLIKGMDAKIERLKEIEEKVKYVKLPENPIMCNNNNILSFSSLCPSLNFIVPSKHPYNTSVEFPKNIILEIPSDNASLSSDNSKNMKHLEAHVSRGNMTSSMLYFYKDKSAIDIASSCAMMVDAGLNFMHVPNQKGDGEDDLRMILEELAYVDVPGGTMLSRVSINNVDDDDFWEEIVFGLGIGNVRARAGEEGKIILRVKDRNWNIN